MYIWEEPVEIDPNNHESVVYLFLNETYYQYMSTFGSYNSIYDPHSLPRDHQGTLSVKKEQMKLQLFTQIMFNLAKAFNGGLGLGLEGIQEVKSHFVMGMFFNSM